MAEICSQDGSFCKIKDKPIKAIFPHRGICTTCRRIHEAKEDVLPLLRRLDIVFKLDRLAAVMITFPTTTAHRITQLERECKARHEEIVLEAEFLANCLARLKKLRSEINWLVPDDEREDEERVNDNLLLVKFQAEETLAVLKDM